MEELRIVIDPTTRTYSEDAPNRSLRPDSSQAVWRDILNLMPREGKLRPRPRLTFMGGLGEVLQPDFIMTAGTNREYPLYIHSGTTTGDLDPFNRATYAVLVTNRQAYVYNSNGWINVTPTYTTGTIAVTNGSATVTGTGTTWSTHKISAGQHILIGVTWYQILSVNTNTSITLTSNYTGSTASGLTYTIRRNWIGNDDLGDELTPAGLVHVSLHRDNLYIAGTYLGSANGSVQPAVIRVEDILSSAPTTTYLTAAQLLQPSLDIITDLEEITGIQNLQDGRVVFSGNRATIFYSSNLLETTWTTSPAGRTLVVGQKGGINALGRLGNNLTLHFDTGITLAYPTGVSDPPLSFQVTTAMAGCVSPRTLKTLNGIEYFAGVSGMIYGFDGNVAHPVGQEVSTNTATDTDVTQKHVLFGFVNPRWNEYGVLRSSSDSTQLLVYQVDTGSWWKGKFSVPIGAISEEDHLSGISMDRRYALAAILSRDGVDGSVEIASLKPILWGLDVSGASDQATAFTGYSSGSNYVTTDDLDFGDPFLLKTIHRVQCLFLGQSVATEDVTCEISRDGGSSWIGPVTKSITHSTTNEQAVQFCFEPKADISWRVRVTCGTVGIITNMTIIALSTGTAEYVSL